MICDRISLKHPQTAFWKPPFRISTVATRKRAIPSGYHVSFSINFNHAFAKRGRASQIGILRFPQCIDQILANTFSDWPETFQAGRPVVSLNSLVDREEQLTEIIAQLIIEEDIPNFLAPPGPTLQRRDEAMMMEITLDHAPSFRSHTPFYLSPTRGEGIVACERQTTALEPGKPTKFVQLRKCFGTWFHFD